MTEQIKKAYTEYMNNNKPASLFLAPEIKAHPKEFLYRKGRDINIVSVNLDTFESNPISGSLVDFTVYAGLDEFYSEHATKLFNLIKNLNKTEINNYENTEEFLSNLLEEKINKKEQRLNTMTISEDMYNRLSSIKFNNNCSLEQFLRNMLGISELLIENKLDSSEIILSYTCIGHNDSSFKTIFLTNEEDESIYFVDSDKGLYAKSTYAVIVTNADLVERISIL